MTIENPYGLPARPFSCRPYARLAHRWVEAGRVWLLCQEVERINQAVPVNGGRPAITGTATEIVP